MTIEEFKEKIISTSFSGKVNLDKQDVTAVNGILQTHVLIINHKKEREEWKGQNTVYMQVMFVDLCLEYFKRSKS